MVYGEGLSIKDSARQLQINYNFARKLIAEYKKEATTNLCEYFGMDEQKKEKRGPKGKVDEKNS
jgi:transposase